MPSSYNAESSTTVVNNTEDNVREDTPYNVPKQKVQVRIQTRYVSNVDINTSESKKPDHPIKKRQARYGDLLRHTPSVNVVVKTPPSTPVPTWTKKPRGRPPKTPQLIVENVQNSEGESEREQKFAVKKPRGRPRKNFVQDLLLEGEIEVEEEVILIKKLRGHSSKNRVAELNKGIDTVDEELTPTITSKRGSGRRPKHVKSKVARVKELDEEETYIAAEPAEISGTILAKRGRGRPPTHQAQVQVPNMITTPRRERSSSLFTDTSSSATNIPRSQRVRHGRVQKTQNQGKITHYKTMHAIVKELVVDIDVGNGVKHTVKLDFQKDIKDNGKRIGFLFEDD
jgi:hypothetical protein